MTPSVPIMVGGLIAGMLIGFLIARVARPMPRGRRRAIAAVLWLLLALPAAGIVWGGLGPSGTMSLFYAYLFLSGIAIFPTIVTAAPDPASRKDGSA